jgi:hypothetical protein
MRRLRNLPTATSRVGSQARASLGDGSFRHQVERPDLSSNSAGLLTVRSGVTPDGCALYRGPGLSGPLAPPYSRLSQPMEPRLVAVPFRHGDLTLQDCACSRTRMIGVPRCRVCALWHTTRIPGRVQNGVVEEVRWARGMAVRSMETAATQSCSTMLSSESLILRPPLYSMKPSFLNLFMKKFTRERVVPIIPASVSCEIFGSTRCAVPCLP